MRDRNLNAAPVLRCVGRGATLTLVGFALAATVLAGCAGKRTATKTSAVTQATKPAGCGSDVALPKDLVTPGSVDLFGEIHGVKELPWFFGEAVCSTASSGLPVGVGLEIPASDQASVDSFLASSGQSSDFEALLNGPFWSRKEQDGRSSQARVDLLERLRRLRAAGLPLRVFLFDISPGQDAAERDKGMAMNIAEQTRSHPNEVTMVLVGDVHAWKTKGAPWDKSFLPMGWHLNDLGLSVYSLGRSTPEGTAWVCDMTGNCGADNAPAYHPLPSGKTSGIELLPTPSSRGNDGLYAVSTLTASPPAAKSSQATK